MPKRWKALAPTQIEAALRMYAAGNSIRKCAAAIDRHHTSVGYQIRQRIGWRDKYTACRRHQINDTAFDRETPDAAYWIGFLMADGCVHKGAVTVEISTRDEAHIRKLKEFLRASNPIKTTDPRKRNRCAGATPSVILRFSSQNIIYRLATHGVTPKKSHTARAEKLAKNRHFWRGVIDGDGYLGFKKHTSTHSRTTYRRPRMHLTTGSTELLQQFRQFCEALPSAPICKTRWSGTCARASAEGRSARAIAAALYDRARTALQRKAATAKQFKKKDQRDDSHTNPPNNAIKRTNATSTQTRQRQHADRAVERQAETHHRAKHAQAAERSTRAEPTAQKAQARAA